MNAEEIITLLDGAGDQWPSVAAEHGWVIECRNDELLRDRVLAEQFVVVRVEFPDNWYVLGSSDANKAQLLRDAMSYDGRLVAAICELAERGGERLPAPAWYRGDYPPICGLDDNGDPFRGFEREVAERVAGECSITVWREDVHTAHGVRCGAPEVHIFDLRGEVTPDQARALAHALLEAADVAETI